MAGVFAVRSFFCLGCSALRSLEKTWIFKTAVPPPSESIFPKSRLRSRFRTSLRFKRILTSGSCRWTCFPMNGKIQACKRSSVRYSRSPISAASANWSSSTIPSATGSASAAISKACIICVPPAGIAALPFAPIRSTRATCSAIIAAPSTRTSSRSATSAATPSGCN